MLTAYLAAFALTLAVEVPVAGLILRRSPWQRWLPAVLLGNAISHPLLHFALPLMISPCPPGPFLLVGEISVFVLEAALYRMWVRPAHWPLALAASAGANAASFAAGLILLPGPP